MNVRRATRNVLQRDKGFTLIEVLLAIALFAVGMLALAGMFAGQMVGHAMGRNMTEATNAGQDMVEQARYLSLANVDALDGQEECRPAPGAATIGWECTPVALGGGGCPPVATPYRRQTTVSTLNIGGFPTARLIEVIVSWCDDIGAQHSIRAYSIRTN